MVQAMAVLQILCGRQAAKGKKSFVGSKDIEMGALPEGDIDR